MGEAKAGIRYYTEEHEWFELDGDVALVGISDHAQKELGDLVYVGDFPDEGAEVAKGDVIGVVESVKATSDVYSPVSGLVEAVNDALEDAPETINSDPEGEGWIVKIKLSAVPDVGDYMDAAAYADYAAEH